MPKPQFTENQIYHIYNRGVEKRNVFLNEKDYFRFIHNLFEFNDTAPASNIYYKANDSKNPQSYEVGLRKIGGNKEKNKINYIAVHFSELI